MSTEINVTVDSGGLLERSKLQQAANRQAFVEGQQRSKAEETGKEQRLERLAEEALTDEQGAALSPAALRKSHGAIYRAFPEPAARRRAGSEYLLLRPSENFIGENINLLHRGLISFGTLGGVGPTPIYTQNAGPNGAAALVNQQVGMGLPNYEIIRGTFPFAGSNSRYKQGAREFTLQFYAKFPTELVEPYNGGALVVFRIGGLGYAEIISAISLPWNDSLPEATRRLAFSVRRSASYDVETVYISNQYLSMQSGAAVQLGAYHHYALTKKGRAVRCFFDGKLLAAIETEWDLIEFAPESDPDWLLFGFGVGIVGALATAPPVYVHGARFDTKALYTGDFTPPPSL